VVHGECPNGTCEDRCLFGPPLPIPNAVTPPVSVCVTRVVAEDASGTAQCEGGAMNLDMPLRWIIHVTGDLLNASSPPDVPGQSVPGWRQQGGHLHRRQRLPRQHLRYRQRRVRDLLAAQSWRFQHWRNADHSRWLD
jgi:hypothetical protein